MEKMARRHVRTSFFHPVGYSACPPARLPACPPVAVPPAPIVRPATPPCVSVPACRDVAWRDCGLAEVCAVLQDDVSLCRNACVRAGRRVVKPTLLRVCRLACRCVDMPVSGRVACSARQVPDAYTRSRDHVLSLGRVGTSARGGAAGQKVEPSPCPPAGLPKCGHGHRCRVRHDVRWTRKPLDQRRFRRAR